MKKSLYPLFLILYCSILQGQEPDRVIRGIFDDALTDRTAYGNLEYLCKKTAGRLDGSPASYKAVEFTRDALKKAGADTVWLQEVTVPHWVRGTERCTVVSSSKGKKDLKVAALGLSSGTDAAGIEAKVIEVHNFDELKTLGKDKIEGKIVFFNRPVNNKLINSFEGYGSAVDQRVSGASEASAYGASAVIVRSVTQFTDDYPHTGVLHYRDGVKKIPAVAVSTIGADLLSDWLKNDPALRVRLVSTCKTLQDTLSYNVIGELRGTAETAEYITVGGHLDAWDICEGAHDDGGGCVQAIETIRLLRNSGVKLKRSVRAVMFMNEEMSSTGGRAYAAEASKIGEKHYAAIESDRGVMSPRGFTFDADSSRLEKLQSLSRYFAPFDIRDFDRGGGGSDIGPLKALGALQIGYIPDVQRYFAYHHSANDTFEEVNIRELQMGSASMASLVYLLDLLHY